MYLSRDEIAHQSESLQRTWNTVLSRKKDICLFLGDTEDVIFLACGSSYWLSLSAHITLGMATGLRTYAVKAGDVLLNPEEYVKRYVRPALVMPSRSGATTEQLKALRIMKEAYPGLKVLSVVEYGDSALAAQSDVSVHIPWAKEVSVCQTRSFSNLYVALIGLAAVYDSALHAGMTSYLAARRTLEERDFPLVEALVEDFGALSSVVALGSGRQYGVTIEGAYICIEMAQMLCAYYGLLEYRHGPIVTANTGTLLAICSNGNALQHEEKMAQEAERFGVQTLAVVATKGFEAVRWRFSLGGDYPKEAVALHYVFVLQAIAYFVAVARGLDPDHPGELVPFIQI